MNQLQSEQINELAAALAIAQGKIGVAEENKTNYFKSKYASYESLRMVCQKPLSENGLCITHVLSMNERGCVLVTQLTHKSGQWMRSEIQLPVGKGDTHEIGKSITYCKRYSLAALICISTGEENEDENVVSEDLKSQPMQMIPGEEAARIEILIKPYGQEYRTNILGYFSQQCKVPNATGFDMLPATSLNMIYESIRRKKEAK